MSAVLPPLETDDYFYRKSARGKAASKIKVLQPG
jgi:hypothetical protein